MFGYCKIMIARCTEDEIENEGSSFVIFIPE